MELKDLERVNPVTRDFHGLSITFNPDAFTDVFYYAVADRFRKRFEDELNAVADQSSEQPQTEKADPVQDVTRLINVIADRIKSLGETIEGNKRFHAALLAGTPDAPVMLEWDLTNEGVPVPCNEEGFLTLKAKTLEDLWVFVRDAADPKSLGMATIPETSTTKQPTQSLSASPETPAAEDHLM